MKDFSVAMPPASIPVAAPFADSVVARATAAFATSSPDRPTGEVVTAALLTLEKAAKDRRKEIAIAALLGTWRLCFSAGKKARFQSGQPVGSGFYLPKLAIAQISFQPGSPDSQLLTVTNQLQIGPLSICFTGPARYPGKKNLLAFDFTQLEVRCFGLRVFRGAIAAKKYKHQSFAARSISKLPFFAFFTATEDYIAARGRGGGLAIWVRQS